MCHPDQIVLFISPQLLFSLWFVHTAVWRRRGFYFNSLLDTSIERFSASPSSFISLGCLLISAYCLVWEAVTDHYGSQEESCVQKGLSVSTCGFWLLSPNVWLYVYMYMFIIFLPLTLGLEISSVCLLMVLRVRSRALYILFVQAG